MFLGVRRFGGTTGVTSASSGRIQRALFFIFSYFPFQNQTEALASSSLPHSVSGASERTDFDESLPNIDFTGGNFFKRNHASTNNIYAQHDPHSKRLRVTISIWQRRPAAACSNINMQALKLKLPWTSGSKLRLKAQSTTHIRHPAAPVLTYFVYMFWFKHVSLLGEKSPKSQEQLVRVDGHVTRDGDHERQRFHVFRFSTRSSGGLHGN